MSIHPYFCRMDQAYPVLDILQPLQEALHQHPRVILQAPPGAGKSTVLPLRLMDEPWLKGRKIIMQEPRRLAAKSVAERLADLLDETPGQRVGYRVRFDTCVGPKTQIEVVTEGILTRMIQTDNALESVGLLIFDEFHERSLQADLALALSLQVQQVLRDDLRILIMSATLDGEALSQVLQAPIITSQGRQFPVDIKYVPQESDAPVPVRTAQAIRRVLREEQGDILVFLPGAGEIKRTQDLLQEEPLPAVLYPLYGDLPFREQQEAILPRRDGQRKVVLSTAIAETSLTIEGITVVIDAGQARVPRFDPRSGLTRLETVRVTKDAADQRAGRAGRLGPGKALRLWTEGTQLNLVAQRKPEILEADLAPMMLELAEWGVQDMKSLTWITPPPAGAVNQARELLRQLEACDDRGITDKGKAMLKLPTHPRMAHLLLDARDDKRLLALATDVAALLEERDPLEREAGADLALRVEVLRKWRKGEKVYADRGVLDRIEKLARQWRQLMRVSEDNQPPADTDVGRLLFAAYPERIAQQQGKHNERYKLANGRMAKLPPHDPLTREPWICVAHLDAGGGEGKIFMAAALHLEDVMGHTREQYTVRWDEDRGLVVGAQERCLGGLILESKPMTRIPDEQRIAVVCRAVQEHGLKLLDWGEAQQAWQARVATVRQWRPDEGWPDVSETSLLETVNTWLAPYLTQVSRQSELARLDLHAITAGLLPWPLPSRLDALAPVRLDVPSGSQIKVQYFEDGRPPVLEVRLQEMFGLLETPTVNEGRTKVLLHLLSPGYKPVQVTQDLRSFWQTTYHEVRKELRMRYPRHHWPEDPWTAEAVRGAKRRTS